MSVKTILNNKHVTLVYHTDTKIVHHRYEPTIGGQFLKDALNAGVEALKEYGAVKWLSDNRAIAGHTDEETNWINTVWLPNAIEAGWKYWALVVPRSFIARINMNEFVESFYAMGVRIMVFTDPDEAMMWLENIDN